MIRQKSSPLFAPMRMYAITSSILFFTLLQFALPAHADIPKDRVWEQISKALAPSPALFLQQNRMVQDTTKQVDSKPLPNEAHKQLWNAVSFTPQEIKDVPSVAKKSMPQNKNMIWPTEGLIYSTFNASRGSRRHGAIDICTSKGTPIRAAQDGTVSVVANGGKLFRGYGKIVILDHGKGVWTLYSHCDTTLVKLGQRVKQGDYIATVGNTGRATTHHLHFEVRVAGVKKDPLKYLPNRPEMVKATNYRAKKSNKKAN